MSYEIVKSINLKNKTITYACNNVRPLTYRTSTAFADDPKEVFIKKCLLNLCDGNFESKHNDNLFKFDYTIMRYYEDYNNEAERLRKIRWDNYDYEKKVQLYTDEEIEQATKEQMDLLYKIYCSIEEHIGHYFINYCNDYYYVVKVTRKALKYTHDFKEAKLFNSKEKAEVFYWYNIRPYNCFKDKCYIKSLNIFEGGK